MGCESDYCLIDPDRSTCLCDAGNSDYIAAITVDRDGEEKLWLAHKDLLGQGDPSGGVGVAGTRPGG
jgi:hypothetical protein